MQASANRLNHIPCRYQDHATPLRLATAQHRSFQQLHTLHPVTCPMLGLTAIPAGSIQADQASFSQLPAAQDSDNKTPYNTQELPDAQPTPNNTLANPRGGQPSPRGNLLGYVASVLSRRNTREVTAANGDRSHGQDPVQALLAAKPGANMQVCLMPSTLGWHQLPSSSSCVCACTACMVERHRG